MPFFLSVSFPRTRREVPSLRGDRGMGRTQVRILFECFTNTYFHPFVSAHTYPFRRLRRHFPRQAGTAYVLYTFLL